MARMTSRELLVKCLSALSSDKDLTEWCLTKYNKRQTVVLGWDSDKPFPATVYPMVAIVLLRHERVNTRTPQTWTIVLGLGLNDPSCVDVEGIEVNAGSLNIEDFRELAETAIGKAGIGKVESGGTVTQEVTHPLYGSATEITVTFQ